MSLNTGPQDIPGPGSAPVNRLQSPGPVPRIPFRLRRAMRRRLTDTIIRSVSGSQLSLIHNRKQKRREAPFRPTTAASAKLMNEAAGLSLLQGIRFAAAMIIVCTAFSAHASGNKTIIDDFSGLEVRVPDPDVVATEVVDSNLSVSVACAGGDAGVIRIPLHEHIKNKKIRLVIADTDGIPFMGKFDITPEGRIINDSFENYRLEHQKRPLYFSLRDRYYANLSLWFKCGRNASPDERGTIEIDKVEVLPLKFVDDRGFVYILSAIVLVLVVLPGILAYSAIFGQRDKEHLLVLVTPLSIACLLVLYGILVVAQSISHAPDSPLLLASYGVLSAGLFAWLRLQNRTDVLMANLRSMRLDLTAVVLVMFAATVVVTEQLDLPLYTMTHQHMRYLTYGAFGAHDTMFQYVNGIALLHDEPFSKYYENYKLLYEVQDRGVLAGVIYAVARGIGAPLSSDIAYSYGYYTLFGIALNVLALLPVFALHRYFWPTRERTLLILFLICANAFLVINFYLTWYKLAGVGLVISGIVLLMKEKPRIKDWVGAGVLWGLAANFHPSLALSYPVVTIWLLLRSWSTDGRRWLPALGSFAGLLGAFVTVMMPWQLVKKYYYEDTNKLFREHFLASQPYDQEHGIVGSIVNFTQRFTLEEQIFTRLDRLQQSLRLDEMQSLIASLSTTSWEETLLQWNLMEAAYGFYAFAPLVVLLALSGAATRLWPATSWDQPLFRHRRDFTWLLATQIFTILMIILATFGKNEPDLTWNLPMSSLVIVLYLLVHANIAVGRIGLFVICVYALFVHYRLFFQYF